MMLHSLDQTTGSIPISHSFAPRYVDPQPKEHSPAARGKHVMCWICVSCLLSLTCATQAGVQASLVWPHDDARSKLRRATVSILAAASTQGPAGPYSMLDTQVGRLQGVVGHSMDMLHSMGFAEGVAGAPGMLCCTVKAVFDQMCV
jgi:hypothetical protein